MRTRLIPFCALSCLVIVACGGGSDEAETTTPAAATTVPAAVTTTAATTAAVTTTTLAPMVVEGATVVVANGNIIGGSAGRMTDALAVAGFTTGPATNASEKIEDSVVYYSAADGAQAVAESLGAKLGGVDVLALPAAIPTEAGTLEGGDVLLVLGNNQADRTLDELAGGSGTEAVGTGATVIVANANTIGGSAGRMGAQLETAGFNIGSPVDASAQATDSVVYYAADAQADAEALGTALGGLTVLPLPDPIPTETGALDGDILLILGANEADRTLAELAG